MQEASQFSIFSLKGDETTDVSSLTSGIYIPKLQDIRNPKTYKIHKLWCAMNLE